MNDFQGEQQTSDLFGVSRTRASYPEVVGSRHQSDHPPTAYKHAARGQTILDDHRARNQSIFLIGILEKLMGIAGLHANQDHGEPTKFAAELLDRAMRPEAGSL